MLNNASNSNPEPQDGDARHWHVVDVPLLEKELEVIDVQQNRSTMAALICKMLHNKLNAVFLLVSGMKVLAVF